MRADKFRDFQFGTSNLPNAKGRRTSGEWQRHWDSQLGSLLCTKYSRTIGLSRMCILYIWVTSASLLFALFIDTKKGIWFGDLGWNWMNRSRKRRLELDICQDGRMLYAEPTLSLYWVIIPFCSSYYRNLKLLFCATFAENFIRFSGLRIGFLYIIYF